ncbi:hypothetical protein CO180_01275 [candidate division WWE3 bacterium CG_4_9_14_3_um_filter_41_6]|nr:MAG: hypothetical protein CO180_01275 [candidate division WWE3 bacterium CG_4_9_14_3_um_filter_41_6]
METIFTNPEMLLKDMFVILIILCTAIMCLFAWVTIGKVRLLNRLVKTSLSPILLITAILFFMVTVGTLISTLVLWIIPLLSLTNA